MRRLAVLTLAAPFVLGCGDDASTPAIRDAGPAPDAAQAAPDAGAVDTARPDAALADALPCEVARIVGTHCARCHGHAPAFGAPMPLEGARDFARTVLDGGRSVAEASAARLGDPVAPMPPTSQPPLPAAELATLKAWLRSGAPAAPADAPACDLSGIEAPDSALPPCEEEAYELRAHGVSAPDDATPYEVPVKDDRYECFAFEVPWTGKRQGVRFDPLIDDARVVHHWLVYQVTGTDFEPGKVYDCSGSHPNSQLLAGWAPGRDPLIMPDDVGLLLPERGSGHFVLEVHYNNTAGHTDARDRSGARLCATSTLRKHEAAVHWLGTESISLSPGAKGKALGACSPAQEATILNTWPHMHRFGRHMTTIIERAGGGQEVLVDQPFNFADQVSYDVTTKVGPGDKLRTTCTYQNESTEAVGFGTSTTAEMCYNFVLAYPAGALSSALGFSLTGARSTCIDAF